MTRVSENSYTASLRFAINKAKEKMEDLQLKGTSLKRIRRPSDDPISNVESLTLKSTQKNNEQYLRNTNYALLQLNTTEKSLEQLSDLLVRIKEIAIQQSSDFYDQNIRNNISNEIIQIRNQILAIANKRIGNRHIFAGYTTLTPPFNVDGDYFGDLGQIKLEIAKDFYIPINLHGKEVFYGSKDSSIIDPGKEIRELKQGTLKGRELASEKSKKSESFTKHNNIFAMLSNLIVALENNDSKFIQHSLVELDNAVTRIISLRTRIGSFIKSIEYSQNNIESEKVFNADHNSKLVDADIAELFSDLTKQQDILKTTYQATKGLINQNLIDFLK